MSILIRYMRKPRFRALLTALFLASPVVAYIIASGGIKTTGIMQHNIPLFVIDAGHGGIDSGAIAADGSKESDINLAIALKLRAMAELYGIDNIMIRQDDITLSDTAEYSEHRDLERRTEIVNNCSNCVYLSVHQNFYPTGQPSGSLVIYASGDCSEKFGKLTHNNLISKLNPENRRLAEPAEDKFYILSHVKCPAILVECGFMSNFSDMEKLKSHNYQSSLAMVMIASFIQYTEGTRYI